MCQSGNMLEQKLEKIGLRMYPYWNSKYLKNIERWSKPSYEIKIERDVLVSVRDGTRLCLDIFRPDAPGKFPALLACSGYSKDIQSLNIPSLPQESSIFDHSIEAGDYAFFVVRGYAHVILDARGTGKSEGEFHGPYSRKEQEDCVDIIEWIAKQPWCDGNIGMIGMSWYGIIQLLTAAQQPRYLKAIFPIHFCGNLYRHAYHGGIAWNYYWTLGNKISANNPKLVSEIERTTVDFQRRVRERIEDPDIANNPYYHKVLAVPKKHSWFADVLLHPLDGPFWQERSPEAKYDLVNVPVYVGTSWGGSPEMRDSAFYALTNPCLNVPKRLICWSFRYDLPLRDLNGEMLRWYDYHLKGIDTGIMDEPPLKLLVRGINRFRYEKEWPLERTKWTKFFLRRFGKLSPEQEGDENLPPDPLVHRPPTISSEVDTLRYLTLPLTRMTEITGPLALYLYASIDQTDANFIVTLSDVLPNGEKTKLQNGFLKASHRHLDAKSSKPWRPVPDHTQPELIKPGEINEYAIPIGGTSYVFKPDHRMGLEITTQDPSAGTEKMSSMGHLPSSRLTYYNIYRDQKYQSHLLLPIIPETPQELYVQ